MKKIIAVFLTIVMLSLPAAGQKPFEIITMEDSHGSKLQVKVPKGFVIKPPALYTTLASYSPFWAISYDNNKVTLTCSKTSLALDDNSIPGFTDQLIALVKQKEPGSKIVDDGILLQDGKNIGYIKFVSDGIDRKRFNYLFYLSVDNKLVLFDFSCPKKLRKDWGAIADEVAASIRVEL